MEAVSDVNPHDQDPHETQYGEVPDGLSADLYRKHLEDLSQEPEFEDAVLSFRDDDGEEQSVAIDDVTSIESQGDGSTKTKIWLRNGAIVVTSGAVIAGAIATVRYRRKHK